MADYGLFYPGILENRRLLCDDWSGWKGAMLRILQLQGLRRTDNDTNLTGVTRHSNRETNK
ncbi:hypothetical protein DPV78_005003 [Talaromyces pinophilus]|nr:hypothetical protein DPV78_005003 [Talaromyces pinophilus]